MSELLRPKTFEKKLFWPDVFISGQNNYENTKESRALAVADGLTGWANCHMEPAPERFGEGMASIGLFLGESILPENLSKMADELCS